MLYIIVCAHVHVCTCILKKQRLLNFESVKCRDMGRIRGRGEKEEKYSNYISIKFKFHIVRHNSETTRRNALQDVPHGQGHFKMDYFCSENSIKN